MRHYAFLIFLIGCASSPKRQESIAKNEIAYRETVKSGLPLFVEAWPGSPNSAGGVSAFLNYYNLSEKSIKYIDIDLTAFNRVGDKEACQIRRSAVLNLQTVGPIEPEANRAELSEKTARSAEAAWYNPDVTCIKMTGLVLTYMDGSKKTFRNSADLRKMQAPFRASLFDEDNGPETCLK